MTGKLLGFLLMVLAAIVAWKWLRRGSSAGRPPAPRPPDGQRRADTDGSAARREGEEKVIELERGKDGVYRPRDE